MQSFEVKYSWVLGSMATLYGMTIGRVRRPLTQKSQCLHQGFWHRGLSVYIRVSLNHQATVVSFRRLCKSFHPSSLSTMALWCFVYIVLFYFFLLNFYVHIKIFAHKRERCSIASLKITLTWCVTTRFDNSPHSYLLNTWLWWFRY